MKSNTRPAIQLAAAAGAVMLLASCGSTGEPPPTATASVPTVQPTSGQPGPTTSAPAETPDTANWEEFSTQSMSFRHPADWQVQVDDCPECSDDRDPQDNPLAQWNIMHPQGRTLIEFRADSALDTDGDMATYERTGIDRESLPADLPQPVSLYAEHFTSTTPARGDVAGSTKERFVVMLISDEAIAERGSRPALAYFTPREGFSTIMESTAQLPEVLGYDADLVGVEEARKIVQSQEYQTVKAIMLSFTLQAG